ncbi:MAG: MBL fold metallo-hydrolase, partial [Chitinophagaceae bacterium]|nr:MBL fold metallo-hydrolase [Anaerolineae bacterium]
VRLDVLYTPGHTPEHIIFQVTDTGADSPIGLFTGDSLFVGDVGRPDLLDATGNAVGTSEAGARQQYENVQRLKAMPDYLQVWPGHGAGSACGKALGAVPSTTIGYEKRFNPAFQQPDAEAFVAWLLDGQPEAPRYFGQMKRLNRVGADLLHTLHEPMRLGEETLLAAVKEMDALVIDTRPSSKFAAGHVRGTLNIPGANQQFSTWAGWFVDYERPTYLVAAQSEIPHLLTALHGIGIDEILGYFTPDIAEKYQWQIEQIAPQTAYELQQEGVMILDVRGVSEREEIHIPGSIFIPLGQVTEKMNELPHERTIITQCGSGIRSQIIASLLEGRGYHVLNLEGGMEAWQKAGLPQEQG